MQVALQSLAADENIQVDNGKFEQRCNCNVQDSLTGIDMSCQQGPLWRLYWRFMRSPCVTSSQTVHLFNLTSLLGTGIS